MGVDPILWNCVGSRSYELKKNLDKTTEAELICYPPLPPGGVSSLGGFQIKNPEEEDTP